MISDETREREIVGVGATDAAVAVQSRGAPHQVVVNTDGSFTPSVLHIHAGETVEWILSDRTDAIIPTTDRPVDAGVVPTPKPYDPTDVNDFTGPLPLAPSGVFALGPFHGGLRVEEGRCTCGDPVAVVGDRYLCETHDAKATMDSTWESPNITGVFISLDWCQVQPRAGTDDASFDFTILDRELEKAMQNGKLYSLAIKAGKSGTPDWIFSTDPDGTERVNGGGGVVRLSLRDSGSEAEEDEDCGVPMDLGSPTDPMYQRHYFDMLIKVADHIKSRADWYRALAYIKPSGANLFTHENRLPKRCKSGCPCNPEIFARHGYTPCGLYNFYRQQFDLLAANFPGKAMSYMLIQAGFPRVNYTGGWEQSDETSSNGDPLPRGTEQTETILDIGKTDHGERFTVQHNGLGPGPAAPASCPTAGIHPAQRPFNGPPGCPNPWVLQAGSDGQTITGFQTNNASGVGSPEQLNATFENALLNSDASFLEIYEARLWEAENTNMGVLIPGGKTIGQWAEEFHLRRRTLFPDIADPFPTVHRHTFGSTGTGGCQVLHYFNPPKCQRTNASYGTIVLNP